MVGDDRLAGVEGFVTSKISWNQYNRFPHDTFRWRGLDGTEIPTHFITTPCESWFYTYNAMVTPEQVRQIWEEYKQKSLPGEPLMTFGFGDGGGGPNEEILERAQRLAAGPPVAGMPRVKFDKAAELRTQYETESNALFAAQQ